MPDLPSSVRLSSLSFLTLVFPESLVDYFRFIFHRSRDRLHSFSRSPLAGTSSHTTLSRFQFNNVNLPSLGPCHKNAGSHGEQGAGCSNNVHPLMLSTSFRWASVPPPLWGIPSSLLRPRGSNLTATQAPRTVPCHDQNRRRTPSVSP